jgi:hypothetical protein
MTAPAPAVSAPLGLWEISPDNRLRIQLHAGQTRAWESERRFVWIIAGTQSGKTSFVPIWLDREIREKGRGDYLAVTATYDLFKLKFFPEMRAYFQDLFKWGYAASDRVLWRAEKPRLFTRIILRSADAEAGLESATAKGAVLDECGQDKFRVTAWEAVQRRLSLSQGRVLGATTPYNLGWLYSVIYQPWKKGDRDSAIIQFKSTMNPSFPRAEYDRMKQKLPAWRFRMFYDGEFTRPAGLIYGDFTEFHKIPRFPIPDRFIRYLSLDFGGVHQAKLWIAEDPGSRNLYVYREALSGDKTTAEHVKEVLDYGEILLRTWGGAGSEGQYRRDWRAAGLDVDEPPISEVEAGIDRVIEVLKGRRLFVFDDLSMLLDEFGTYSRKLDEFGEPTEEIKDKKDFHLLDALRYGISGILSEGSGSNYQTKYA